MSATTSSLNPRRKYRHKSLKGYQTADATISHWLSINRNKHKTNTNIRNFLDTGFDTKSRPLSGIFFADVPGQGKVQYLSVPHDRRRLDVPAYKTYWVRRDVWVAMCVWVVCELCMQHIDSDETEFVVECPHVVKEVSRRRRSNVELIWTAPPPGAGCIEFRSQLRPHLCMVPARHSQGPP